MGQTRISKEDLVRDLQSVARKLKKSTVLQGEYSKYGSYPLYTLLSCLGSGLWSAVLSRADLGVAREDKERPFSDDDLFVDLKRVSELCNKENISVAEYDKHGNYSSYSIRMYLGGGKWIPALKKAGLSPSRKEKKNGSKDDYIIDLQRVTERLHKRSISRREYDDSGIYSSTSISKAFGKWSHALKKAGLKIAQVQKASPENLIKDLERVATQLGRNKFTHDEYQKYGEYSCTTLRNHFGLWNSVLLRIKKFNVKSIKEDNVTDKEIIDDFFRVLKFLDKKSLTKGEYKEHGCYSVLTITGHFRSWYGMLKKAGMKPTLYKNIPDNDLISDLKLVAQELKQNTLTTPEYNLNGKYSSGVFQKRFGSWNNSLEKAGFEITRKNVSNDHLFKDLIRVALKLNQGTISITEYNIHGEYNSSTYCNRFGTWNVALKRSGLEKNEENKKVSIKELILDLQHLAQKRGTTMISKTEYDKYGRYSAFTICKYFGSWNEALLEAGLIPRITSEKSLLELCSKQEIAHLAVILCKGDEIDLADVLAIVTDGTLSSVKLLKLLRRPTLKEWLGEFQNIQPSLSVIGEIAIKLLPYEKNGFIKSILIDRIKEHVRDKLGAKPTKARITEILNMLNDQSLELKEIA